MAMRAIGVDVGGSQTKIVLLEAGAKVVDTLQIPSAFRSGEAAVEALAAATAPWIREPDGEPPGAIGLGVPALIERSSGTVLRAPNLPALDAFAIGPALAAATGLPVALDNDANVAGLAEAALGAARGCSSAVCLTVGTGVGAAIILEGRLWRGHRDLAGEIGRLILEPEGRLHFEKGVGAAAIVREYERAAGSTSAGLEAAVVSDRAAAGDEAAQRALEACGRRLGLGLAILVNLLNPERIVVGGGVAAAGDWFLGAARREARRRSWAEAWKDCDVVLAALGARAGAIGAALLAGGDRG